MSSKNNIGHFALYPFVDATTKAQLAGYYREGIEHVIRRGQQNPYHVGVPFLWCSNNLVVAFITQVLLYERMTGDMRYHLAMLAGRSSVSLARNAHHHNGARRVHSDRFGNAPQQESPETSTSV